MELSVNANVPSCFVCNELSESIKKRLGASLLTKKLRYLTFLFFEFALKCMIT